VLSYTYMFMELMGHGFAFNVVLQRRIRKYHKP
jgi:hypothetical protein